MSELSELIPMGSGVAVGLLCSAMTPGRRRVLVMILLSALCGLAATVVSGEFLESWGYLLLDIPLTVGMAAAAMLTPAAMAALVRSIRG